MKTYRMCTPFLDTSLNRAGMDCQMWLYQPIWCSVDGHGIIASQFPWQTIPNKLLAAFMEINEMRKNALATMGATEKIKNNCL